ncbi:MAG: OmpA family protein [Bacteroidota bacterium]|nr:OmpA family protein [Bacteroidota bacterium]
MIVINLKRILLFLTIFNFCQLLLAQNVEFRNANFRAAKGGLKAAQKSIKIADEFREKALLNFLSIQDARIESENAYLHYQKAHSFNPNNADLNYKIASVLLFTNRKEFAKEYLDKAISLSAEFPPEFYFFQGMVLQLDGEYTKAIESYQYFMNNAKKKVVEQYDILTKRYIEECTLAPDLLAHKHRIWVDNLAINSEYDDWSPCLSADGELLIFTSNRKNENIINEIGAYDQDIYYSNLSGRNFKNISSLSELNTLTDDVSGGLSYDGQRLLIYKEEDGNTDVFESKLNGKYWDQANRKMGEKLRGGNTDADETFASFDPPDIKVYYITDGGYSSNKDIYFSGVMNRERNIWGKGQSAGVVNTKFQEGSVYIHPDARTMYFSSKGHNSLGGYDIFVSYVDELGHWGKPVNLGYPINTPYDDLFYSATASGRYAYIASNRAGGKGGLDIYKVTYWGADKPMTSDSEDQLMASIASPVSDKSIAEPIAFEEKSLTVFKGRILDGVTKKSIAAAIDITINKTGKIYTSAYSNSATGKFLLSLPAGENYGISVVAEGYLFHSENFDLPKGDGFNMVTKDIELKNIKVGNNIALKNVFFNTGKWDVKSDSYAELDRLAALLAEILSLRIEISGHTDDVGAESFNELLSQRRADAVVNYLVGKGVDKNRLIAKGYGQSKPVESNNTEEGRASNRRTEFEIIEN